MTGSRKSEWGSPIGFGVLSGLLVVLSLPKPDLYPLAWIALAPMLVTVAKARSWRLAALSSYAAGVIFFAGTFYWITETMSIYGGLSLASAVGVGLLFAISYALHFVFAAIPVWLAVRRWGPSGVFIAAPLWVAVELLRAHWLSGFPWMLFGYALAPFTGLLQMVTVTGIYGLSFVAVAVNSGIAFGMLRRKWSWAAGSLVVALSLSILPVLPAPQPAQGTPIDVRIVQTNISLDQDWQPPHSAKLMDDLTQLSTAAPGQVRLIVWPETPAPFYLKEDPDFRRRIQSIARESNAYVLVGYIDQFAEGPTNSAGLVDPAGQLVSRYDKQHLVPFGEYVPLKWLLTFAESLTRQVGEFIPGRQYTISPVDQHSFSTAICYESIFPGLVRKFVDNGAELLIVITNDGWFGESSAPFQHLRMGVVRAVENRRYEVRTANTGISAIIDPYGRILSRTPLDRRMVLDGKVYFRGERTFYTAHGDVFAYLNVAAVGFAGIMGFAGRRRKHVRRVD